MDKGDLPAIEPAPGRERRFLPAAFAFLLLASFSLWGLGLAGWPLALSFGLVAAGLVWVFIVLTERAVRKAAALFLAGLREGGLEVRAARCQADWLGNTKRVEFDTALGRGWVLGDSRGVAWLPPWPAGVAPTYTRLWNYSPHGPNLGRFALDDWRVCMRRAGQQEGRKLVEAARPPVPTGRQGYPRPPG